MKYFTHLSSYNNPKNKLQRQALDLLKANSNFLVSDCDAFVANIKAEIGKLNAQNPRCTSLRVSTNAFTPATTNIYLGDTFTVGFSIYLVKNGGAANA